MTDSPSTALALTMDLNRVGEFYNLLQQGFGVTAHVGCTLERLLGRQWGLDPDYVTRRITTIFLDGRAIDDIKTAVVRDGAVLALSGAMPGLVGATMRRGGYYAAMRGAMTHRESAGSGPDRIGTIRVKVFNILLPELAPDFLGRGMIVPCSELRAFIKGRDNHFWQGCHMALLNNGPVTPMALAMGELLPSEGMVRLTVTFKDKQ